MTVEVQRTGGGEEVPLHKRLIHLFNAGGRPLSSDALNALLQHFEGSEDVPKERVQTILTELSVGENPTVTLDDIEPLLQRLQLQDSDDDNTIQVISCFEMPRYEWDQSHKRFVRCPKAASIHGEPLSKPQVVLGRLQMLNQCVQRVIGFQAGSSSKPDLQITPVKALVGTGASTKTVLGMVRRDISKGRVYVEDFSGVAQVANLQAADCSAVEGYISDGCCILLQGSLLPNQAFGVKRIMEPHMESRQQAIASLRGRCLSGAQPLRPSVLRELHHRDFEDESQRLVFLNGCHLDDPIVLQSIAAVLHGYDGLPEGPPPVITLLGPFFKPRCGGSVAAAAPQPTLREMTAAFEALAAAINLFPAIQAHSKIVLVPAPGDPGCFGVLPQRPVPAMVAQPVLNTPAHVVLASNPCRLQFFRKEVVVFNSPCMDAFQSHSLVQSTGEETAAEDVFVAACTTMIKQRHLSPFPLTVQPVHWEFDASLALFPQPDALVVPYEALLCNADVHGVRCICPGSVKLGTFAAYIPLAPPEDGTEGSEGAEEIPDADDTSRKRTQASMQPNSQNDTLAEERLQELKGGSVGLTTGAGRRLGGGALDTSELPDLAPNNNAVQEAAAQRTSAGRQPGGASGARKEAAAERGCVVEECEVPIEAAEDKGSEDDSESDMDPDGFGGRSEDGDPIDGEALDSEEDDFDTGRRGRHSAGSSEDDMEASDAEEAGEDDEDDALFAAADEAVARRRVQRSSKSTDNSMEDEDVE